MLSQITVSSQVIHLYPPKLIFHFTSEHRHTEVVRTSLFIVTHLSVCRTVTCIAAQQRKNVFSLKTLMLTRCYYSSVPTTDFSLGQSQACLCLGFWYGKFKLMQGLWQPRDLHGKWLAIFVKTAACTILCLVGITLQTSITDAQVNLTGWRGFFRR